MTGQGLRDCSCCCMNRCLTQTRRLMSPRCRFRELPVRTFTGLVLVLILTWIQCVHSGGGGGGGVVWQMDYRPTRTVNSLEERDIQRFMGNESHVDHFKLLERDGEFLLVGARNIVYNLSLHDLGANPNLVWHASDQHVALCQLKGKSEDDCQNYIRVLVKTNSSHLLVCGTNAYKPMCRHYYHNAIDEYKYDKEVTGQGLCPYDPSHNSTAVYADGALFVATVADFSATDPLIYREPLRTEQFDPTHLNAPNFVSSMSHGGYVYYFLRETAVEYINCGKTVYSRVARVCAKDKGGMYKFSNRWSSFLKARLNCSVGGEFPFYFNEIQSTSHIVRGLYNGRESEMIYGIFTTPPNSISGSAICAFRMQDILSTFDGSFKEQENVNAVWKSVPSSRVPEPRPGQCVNDSRTLPDINLHFIKAHTLMDSAVPAYWGHPILIKASTEYRFTQVTVDPQVRTPDGRVYDMLFIGTDNGRVLMVFNAQISTDANAPPRPVIVEDIRVFNSETPITNLRVYRSAIEPQGKLIVVSNEEIQAIKLYRCRTDTIKFCSECVALQNPYCAWEEKNKKCTHTGLSQWSLGEGFIQNVAEGRHPRCNDDADSAFNPNSIENSGFISNSISDRIGAVNNCPPCPYGCGDVSAYPHDPHFGAARDSPAIYTAETLAIALATSAVAALVIGFVCGYAFSKRCKKQVVETPYTDDRYDRYDRFMEQTRPLPCGPMSTMRPLPGLRDQPLMNHMPDGFLCTPPSNNKPINLVLNVPPKNLSNKNMANSSADNKPMQKVKKIYL